MTPERQKLIDKIFRISDWCIKGILLVGLIVMFIYHEKPFWWTAGILLGVSVLVNVISGIWATDEEKEQRKNDIKEALQEVQEDEIRKKRRIPSDEQIKSPLKGLTPQQEAVIIDMLRNNILVENNRLKTSELKHMLLALERQGDIDVSDIDRVIAWVMQVTGYDVDTRNLKYDYTAKYSEKEIVKWGNKIRERYDQIEIF